MKTLFVIGYVWPEPNSSAAGARMMQLLRFFRSEGYNIIFGTTAIRSAHAEDLENVDISTETIELNNASFDQLLKKIQPEIVLFDRFMMEEQFGWRVSEVCPDAVQILDTEDLHFLRKARQAAQQQQVELTPALLHSDFAKREIASIYRCDLSLIISQYEMKLLQKEFSVPGNLLFYLPFMLHKPSEKEIKELPSFDIRKNFISIGNFLHEPNRDVVRLLKQKIWPLIRRKLPEAKIHIFGAYVSAKVEQLHNEKEGFLIEGRAESAISELKKARVLLAPLRFGAGIKGKFTDGMIAGTPNITTTIGAEGMFNDRWNGLIADDPENFAEAAVKLYSEKGTWLEARRKGFEILENQFSEAEHRKRLERRLQELLDRLEEHRTFNFTGAMLRHHHLKSTKYLSRFIEMKNELLEERSKNKDHPQNG